LISLPQPSTGDIIYARQWPLVSANGEGESKTELIPCWILLTISQTSLVEGGALADNMQIISIEVSVVLFSIGEFQSEQEIMMEDINSQLKVRRRLLTSFSS
jgi:hypothetical protein